MRTWLPIAHLVLTALLVAWDVALAGRIAQMRKAPRLFAALTALAGFLLLPALLLTLAASSAITGRALVSLPVQLLWPATAVAFAVQSVYALVRRLVYPLLGVPIAVYNVLVAGVIVLRFAATRGADLPQPALFFLAAYSDALVLVAGIMALTSPFFFLPPLTSPAFPALRPVTAMVRGAVAFLAGLFSLIVMVALFRGVRAVQSYEAYASVRLTERPENDFRLGLKILPDLARPPVALALRNDLALADTLDVRAVAVTIVPDAASAVMLDSVAHALETMRRDTTLLIVSLGYRGRLVPSPGERTLNVRERLRAVERVVRRLQPDILLPAEDPYGAGTETYGYLPVERWQEYVTEAATLAKRLRPRTRIGLAASSFGVRDSALYAWAARRGSPVDVVGFSFAPSQRGAEALDASMRAADRWMRGGKSPKQHWVFAARGFPVAHGETSQERALWGVLAWATARPQVKGVVIATAGDYGPLTGLRAPSGRLRRAAYTTLRGIGALREASDTTGSAAATRADTTRPADTSRVSRDTTTAGTGTRGRP